jgi:predicted HAD superfamily hydrolase
MSLREDVKRKVYTGKPIDAENLYKQIESYQFVSFDIFDTLVKRNVAESIDIFEIVGLKINDPQFKEKRIAAETQARNKSTKSEVTFSDIYKYYPGQNAEELIRTEVETELQAMVTNNAVVDVYNRCIESGKTVFITSDMYWGEDEIKRLLEKCGIKDYKRLYLSSIDQETKRQGGLFRKLLREAGIKANQLVHIGDSIEGDYKKPIELGIKAIRIPRYVNNNRYPEKNRNSNIRLNYLNTFINNTISPTENLYYQFGFSQFGKLIGGGGYCKWIHDLARKKGITKLYFLSRDGFIMKQAYDICFHDDIKTFYLEVSRRSLRVPILWLDCSPYAILKMVVNAKLVPIQAIFDGIGLDIAEYKQSLERYGFSDNTAFDRTDIFNNKQLRDLLVSLQKDIIENSQQEYKELTRYLREQEVSGKFGIVDIGYAGSMQMYLHQVLDKLEISHEITGFYLGVAPFYKKNTGIDYNPDLNGYLFDFYHNPNDKDCRSSFVGLFESLFLEQDGSVKNYKEKDGREVAVRYPYEYFINGKPSRDYRKIKDIQRGAIDFVKRASGDELLISFKFTSSELFYGIYCCGTNPSQTDLKLFAQMKFYDEGTTAYLAKPKSATFYAAHLKQLKEDFLQCRWKTAFLKQLMKLPLNYLKIYESLQKYR